MTNRKLSVHQEHELLLKLEKAGLGPNLAQAVIESPENCLASRMVGAVSFHWMISGTKNLTKGMVEKLATELFWELRFFYYRYFGIDLLDQSMLKNDSGSPGQLGRLIVVDDLDQSMLENGLNNPDRLIVVAKGLTPTRVLEACSGVIPCRMPNYDLDLKTKGGNQRSPADQSYVISVEFLDETNRGSKKVFRNPSANTLREVGLPVLTLTECLLYVLKYAARAGAGGYPDNCHLLLCVGTHDSEGSIPYLDWTRKVLKIGWIDSRVGFPNARVPLVAD